MNVAITTCDINPEQSTFIVSQRNLVKGVNFFLYGGLIPLNEYKLGYIGKLNFRQRLIHRVLKKDIKKKALELFLKKNKVDIVLAQYGVSAASILNICMDNCIKLIPHFHGYDAYEYKILKHLLPDYKKVFEYSSFIISVSEAMKKQLISLGAPENKIIVNPCAPNDDFYNVKPDYNSNKLISIGRFVDKKAPYLTVFAFAKAKELIPELQLVMIGEGPLLNATKNIVKYLGLEESILFLGEIQRNDIISEMNKSFCYVQHSIRAENGDSEGTPVAIMEAGAAGLPIVSTRHAGIPDAAIDGKAAFLVEEMDVVNMAKGIVRLAKDRDLCKKMGARGREHIRKNLSMEKYISNIDYCIAKAIH